MEKEIVSSDGIINPLAQFKLAKPALPDVPLARDLVKTALGRQAIDLLTADSVFAWPVAPRRACRRSASTNCAAFVVMMADGELRSEAARRSLDIDPIHGGGMQRLTARLCETPPEVIGMLQTIDGAR
jgi:hypothetical protein